MVEHQHSPGNHGDVTKGVVFVNMIKKLQQEHPEGIVIADAFAGAGVYHLKSIKPKEYERGIFKVVKNRETAPKPVEIYIKSTVGWSATKDNLEYYPGSPAIGQKLLRKQDEHRLCDLNISEMQGLNEENSHFEQLDAWDKDTVDYLVGDTGDKHPVVLVDAPFNDPNDYGRCKDLLSNILEENPKATVMIWVPLVDNSRYRWSALKMLKETAKAKAKIGQYTATVCTGGPKPLIGSAMFIANPTEEFDELVNDEALAWLAGKMCVAKGDYSVEQRMKKYRPIEEA